MSSVLPAIGLPERRARLAGRHHLAPALRAATVEAAADAVVGLHASDPASVYLQARARVRDLSFAALETALYERRSLLKLLGMRRTMFVVSREVGALLDAGVTQAIGRRERARLVAMLRTAGIGEDDPETWLATVEGQTMAVLDQLGEATAADLTRRVPGLRQQIPFGEGRSWQGRVGVSTRLLFLLACEGRLIRGRPRGSWLSSLYRWAPMNRWIPGGLDRRPVDEARVDIVRRWLRAFGPGTEQDLAWWTGLGLGEVRRALDAQDPPATRVGLGAGVTGLVLADDLQPSPDHGPWLAFLPALDATAMGWRDRRFFLGGHERRLFDRNGNAGPMIVVDGRVIGGWAHLPSGRIATRRFEDVGAEASASIDAEAAALEAWLGESRVIPRFRTPTEVELTSDAGRTGRPAASPA